MYNENQTVANQTRAAPLLSEIYLHAFALNIYIYIMFYHAIKQDTVGERIYVNNESKSSFMFEFSEGPRYDKSSVGSPILSGKS